MNHMASSQRACFALVINLLGMVAGVAIMWQAVRFCQGHVGVPILDQILAWQRDLLAANGFGPVHDANPGQLVALTDLAAQAFYYLSGISVWLMFGAVVSFKTQHIARIVEVGYEQYQIEAREALREQRRLEKIDADRVQRRELRQKRREALQPKQFSLVGVLYGIALGAFFF